MNLLTFQNLDDFFFFNFSRIFLHSIFFYFDQVTIFSFLIRILNCCQKVATVIHSKLQGNSEKFAFIRKIQLIYFIWKKIPDCFRIFLNCSVVFFVYCYANFRFLVYFIFPHNTLIFRKYCRNIP